MDKTVLNNLALLFRQESSLSSPDLNAPATVADIKKVSDAVYNLILRMADESD